MGWMWLSVRATGQGWGHWAEVEPLGRRAAHAELEDHWFGEGWRLSFSLDMLGLPLGDIWGRGTWVEESRLLISESPP